MSAWRSEDRYEALAAAHGDVLLHVRRLVAQRCLYCLDRNDPAVGLAKLSLWLVTLVEDLPFTFVDHTLRHGDSLVGRDSEQIRAFHWAPAKQTELPANVLDEALDESVFIRRQVMALSEDASTYAQRRKEQFTADVIDANKRA